MEVGGGGDERESIYLSLHCHHHSDLNVVAVVGGFYTALFSALDMTHCDLITCD